MGAQGPFLGTGVKGRVPGSPAALRRPEPWSTGHNRGHFTHFIKRLREIHANIFK